MHDSDSNAPAIPLKAYEDLDFLKKDVCRSVRLQLEFLKPDYMLDLHQVESTIVIFGSARTLPPDVAKKHLQDAQDELTRKPGDASAQTAVKRAERMLRESHFYQVARDFAA